MLLLKWMGSIVAPAAWAASAALTASKAFSSRSRVAAGMVSRLCCGGIDVMDFMMDARRHRQVTATRSNFGNFMAR